MDHGTGLDVDDLVVKPHLALSLEEEKDLLEPAVAVPVARLLAGLEGVGGETDDLGIQLVVHNPPALLASGFNEAAEVFSPTVKWPDLCLAVFTHGPNLVKPFDPLAFGVDLGP